MASLAKSKSSNSTSSTVDDWIRERFMKRECVRVVPISRDSSKCGCGRHLALHYYFESEEDSVKNEESGGQGPGWSIDRCTITYPTDAYGTLTFKVGKGSRKARYVRADFDADPSDLWRLLVDVWGLEPPTLIITVQDSGEDPSSLAPSFIKAFKRGLSKAARTASTWIITTGLKHGINEHVTAAFHDTSMSRSKSRRIHVIGFAPWGSVRGAERLLTGVNGVEVPYYGQLQEIGNSIHHRRPLAEGHSGFILVDDGTLGKPATRAHILRRRFEDFLRDLPMKNSGDRCIPMACLLIDGKLPALNAFFDYVTTNSPAPVVACAGTGGVADWISMIYEKTDKNGRIPDTPIQRRLLRQIQAALGVDKGEAYRLANAVTNAVISQKNFITIYRAFDPDRLPASDVMDGRPEQNELDVAMLNALLKGLPLTSIEKLNLTVTWEREDLAKEILEEAGGVGLEWPNGSLDEAMMNALMYDRVDFVNLLLSHGIGMDRFLTIARLEQLYNSDSGPPNTLRFILPDVVKNVDKNHKYKLSHIGLIIEKLMGSGFRSTYCRQEFRKRYKFELQYMQRRKSTMANVANPRRKSTVAFVDAGEQKRPSIFVPFRNRPHFAYPYHELFIWAVLTNRKQLAICFWQNGQEQLAKALLGSRLYQSLAQEAEEDYLEMGVCQQLVANASEFKTLACDLLAQCYETDDDMTIQLLTYELRQFSKSTCISLAASSKNETFVAHQSCQLLLADLWLGGLRLRKSINFKVMAGILCPPLIATLPFKTKEELQLQAQTAEESETYRGGDRDRKKSWQDDSSSFSSNDDESEIESETIHDVEAMTIAEDEISVQSSMPPIRRDYHFETAETTFSSAAGITVTFSPSTDENNENNDKRIENRRKHSDQLSLAEGSSSVRSSNRRRELQATNVSFMDGNQDPAMISNRTPKPFRRFATAAELNTNRLGLLLDTPPVVPTNRPKQRQPLEISRKILEFYSAPVTTFWSFTIGYAIFLSFFTYIVLVKTPLIPQWPEYYVIAFFIMFSADHIRKILVKEPRQLKAKIKVFAASIWDSCTALACISFFFALVLRLDPDTVATGRVLYCINIVFWYLRVLRLMSVNSSLSPYINMYGKMVVQLLLLSTILFVTLASFGILRQGITRPDEDWQWASLRNICYKPYSMLYGSLYPEDITECDDAQKNCTTGYWLTPIFMTIYLLLAIVVFMNMMVAAFSHIFTQVNSRAQEIAKFETYYQVMEFEQQPFLPPPFVVLSHIYMVGKYIYKRFWKKDKTYRFEHSLKLFLTPDEKEKLHDFERDCVTELLAKKEERRANTLDARLEYFSDRLDAMTSQIDYLHEQDQSHRLSLLKFEKLFLSSTGHSDPSLATTAATVRYRKLGSYDAPPSPMRSISEFDTNSKKSDVTMTIGPSILPHFANGHAVHVQKPKPPLPPSPLRMKDAGAAKKSPRIRMLSEHDSTFRNSEMRRRSGSAPTPPSWKKQGMKGSVSQKVLLEEQK